jgi:2,4-dienoyl-CoA reductase [(3E)-enoyl-CoA-producing], peroxisomal
MTESTGQEVLPVQADVRIPQMLKDAVVKTIEQFGRIDYVICGILSSFDSLVVDLLESFH